MKWIQATLTFDPDQYNASRIPSHAGVWRVHHCSEVGNPLKTRVEETRLLPPYPCTTKVLRLMVARPYQRGAIVKPIKLAREFDEALRVERDCVHRITYQQPGDIIYFGSTAHA